MGKYISDVYGALGINILRDTGDVCDAMGAALRPHRSQAGTHDWSWRPCHLITMFWIVSYVLGSCRKVCFLVVFDRRTLIYVHFSRSIVGLLNGNAGVVKSVMGGEHFVCVNLHD